MFEIQITESALTDLAYLDRFEQVIILRAIARQLAAEPTVQARNRKPLRPNDLGQWALRVEKYRAFYDVDGYVVTVKAVGWKEHNKLFIRGKEFIL